MKKSKLIILLLVLMSQTNAHSQEFYLKDSINFTFGMKDSMGKIIPSLSFSFIGDGFSEGLAKVGQFIPYKTYDNYLDSSIGYGFVDRTGKMIIPMKYHDVEDFYGGVSFVEIIHHAKNENESTYIESKLINKRGTEYSLFQNLSARHFQEGIVVVGTEQAFGCKGKLGFMDSLGREITPMKYDQVWDFSEGMAAVNVGANECEGGKWGFIDKTGKEVIPLIYDCVGMIDSGYDLFGFQFGKAIVCLDGKDFYIDKKGKVLNGVTHFSDTTYLINFSENEKSGLKNVYGKIVIQPKYDFVSQFHEGLLRVNINRKCGFIDKTEKVIIPIKYDSGGNFSEGLAYVGKKEQNKYLYGFTNKKGEIIVPIKYEETENFNKGKARVKLDGKWGFIDEKGKEIVSCKYEQVTDFSEGFAGVKLNGLWGYINTKGEEVVLPKYEFGYEADRFQRGCVVVKGKKWIVLDSLGREREFNPDEKFKSINSNDSDGFFRFQNQKNGKIGLLDKCGNEILSPTYLSIGLFSNGLANVTSESGQGFIDEKGREVIPCIYSRSDDFWNEKAKVKLYDRYYYIDKNGKEIK